MALNKNPQVSVLISVYRADLDVLRESLDSIFSQSFTDFEVIIVDDGNEPLVSQYISDLGVSDARVTVIKNPVNIGLTASLVIAGKLARGVYLARQDADDVSLPGRLERQVSFMRAHPDLALLGGSYLIRFGLGGRVKEYFLSETDEADIQEFFFRNPICHSSAMFRRDIYDLCGGYDPAFYTTQDLDLWFRLARHGRVGFLSDRLVERRILRNSISVSRLAILQVFNSLKVRLRERSRLGRRFSALFIFYIGVKHVLSIFLVRALRSF